MTYYVYGFQQIDLPTGPIKIGFSSQIRDRIPVIELGALGRQLQSIFQVPAGETYGEGRRLEYLYHKKFYLDRINREWFRFNPEMLTWSPEGFIVKNYKVGSPAENTIAAKKLEPGDLIICRAAAPLRALRRNAPCLVSPQLDATFMSSAKDVQKIIQRTESTLRHNEAQLSLPQLSSPSLSSTQRHANANQEGQDENVNRNPTRNNSLLSIARTRIN